ncbi:MAG TPA: Mur ligase family protein [Negativicutes bacterium]|nr:MAG: hypothetical protein A3A12_01290 [Candidatus Staskawiczbacteria bacterium RIFCSPLOWO2_01_FULL_43_17b]HLD70263.1 Mur ligase family protein [Negativicutes bacterium]
MDAKATFFEFSSYIFEPKKKRAVFTYKTEFSDGREPIIWTETIALPKAPLHDVPQKLLESLHIMLGISYWKFYCATPLSGVKVRSADRQNIKLPYHLSKMEADFWNTVYKKGLGEFFYKNNLDPKVSPKFPFSKTANPIPYTLYPSPSKCLVGIGGGKDSIVSAELLKEAGFDTTAFHIETQKTSPIVNNVIKTLGVGDLKIQRILDPKVHEKHPYNGHIPISAIYAFLGIFSCVLYGYDYFIVSNEHSSNFGNIKYKGLDVNHQWSKSFEFETLFSDYIKNYITPNATYFSLLRPFYEIRIVKMFAQYPQYFRLFSSCNRNFAIKGASHGGLWCNQCAKCVFAWAMFSASLPKKKVVGIFGKDLLKDKSLEPIFKDITGQGTMKPFDCVGTFQEAQEALGIKRHPEVFTATKENAVPEEFKFLGMETVQIVREEGLEGQATKKFLKKYYPKLKIVKKIADITIKTPGINKSQMTGYYTTPTNMFFSRVKNKNLIIGVTGSKGKSTTSSLIYHILKTSGKNVQLLGNIGKPMLDILTNPKLKTLNPNQIFVLELSSYQLDDIKFSPDIAVITNLFPEHMDFHGSLKNYYSAKKNIYRFQKAGDHLVDRPKAKKHYQSNLLGQHNQNNIQAAVELAKILKIPPTTIEKAIATFKPLPHRLENIGTYKGITFYDDAISTTPESTIMAIKAIKNIDTIFLGGQDRGYAFDKLEKTIRQHNIKNIVLFPDSGKKMLRDKKGLNIFQASSMPKAVKFAYKHTQQGSVCLLSCASPSYSLWKNFEVKGDEFKKFVKKYSTK